MNSLSRWQFFVGFVSLLISASLVEAASPWQLPPDTTAVVTGGTKGIGKAIVEELALKGSRVLTCARNPDDLDKCVKEWKAQGLDVTGVAADVATGEGRKVLMDKIYSWLDGKESLDILVNNVGTNIRKPSVDYTDEDIQKVWNTNYHSMFALTVACHPLLKREPGTATSSVINVGSIAGVTCIKSGAPYGSTKAAMNQLTGNLACEWGPHGIRVNCVSPVSFVLQQSLYVEVSDFFLTSNVYLQWYINTELAQQVLKNEAYRSQVLSVTPSKFRFATIPLNVEVSDFFLT
jgi:Tropinone reductase 1